MPQNPLSYLVAKDPSNLPAPLRVDDAGALTVTLDAPSVSLTSVQTLGTIATTGTFQACLAANADRAVGGAITNHGTASMTVSLSASGDAVAGQGLLIAAGGNLLLSSVFPDEPYTGAISITGTKSDTFSTLDLTKVVA